MPKTKRNISKGQQPPKNKSKLPLYILLGGAVILLLAAFITFQKKPASATPNVTGSPSLKVDKEKVDLGDQKLGNPTQVSFTLTNLGDQPLIFSKPPYVEVKVGCCPPTPSIGSMTLQPGETKTLSIQFVMHGNMGGKHDFRVHIPNNDPKQKDITLTVLSNWIP